MSSFVDVIANTNRSSIRINPCGLLCLGIASLLILYYTFGRTDNREKISIKTLLSASIDIAKKGGHIVKTIREKNNAEIGEKSKGKTAEGANNPVTDGDMLSHRAMYYGLIKGFPNLNVISEEDDPEPVDMNTVEAPIKTNSGVDAIISDGDDVLVPIDEVDVWIDPLDATQEYTENLLQYVTTMVCIAVRGQPVVGVIYKPFSDKTAWGWAGPNFVSSDLSEDIKAHFGTSDYRMHQDLSKAKIIVSRSHAGHVHEVAQAAFGAAVNVTGAGGAGFKAWEVAKGSQDAYIHATLIKKWDICPGDAVLGALGGKMTDLSGNEIDYSGKPAYVKAEGGVLATLHDHNAFLEKLKPAMQRKR